MKKKLIALLLAVCTVAPVMLFAACNRDNGIDKNRTQLYVGIMDDGIGSAWLYELKNRYEAQREDIQIIVDVSDDFEANKLLDGMPHYRQDVYFASIVNYSDFLNGANNTSTILADITDVVTDSSGGKSLHDKLYDGASKYFNAGTQETPRYYGLPYAASTRSLIYDADLFEVKELYNLPEYRGIDNIDNTADDNWGPDGKEGTYDDGLPGTWEDMKLLINIMAARGVIPFTWSYTMEPYRSNFLHTVWAGYEGVNDYSLGYYLEGEHENSLLGEVNQNNGYVVMEQQGRKAALEVADFIMRGDYYSKSAFNTTQTHVAAQTEYILSATPKADKPIAFLIEGGWWENESRGVFDEAAAYGEEYAYGERNFKYFPFPRFIGTDGIADQVNEQHVMHLGANITGSACLVNGKTKKLDIAKDFIKFAYSEASLQKFTEITSVIRPMEYTMDEASLSKLTPFARSVWEVNASSDTAKLVANTRSPFRNAARSYFSGWGFWSKIGTTTTYSDAFSAFKGKNITVAAYFQGGITGRYNQTDWEEQLRLYKFI